MSSVFKTAESITQVYLSTSSSAEEFVEGVSDDLPSKPYLFTVHLLLLWKESQTNSRFLYTS
mgnify:FL=1